MKQPIFTGSAVAIVSPFNRETLDISALRRLLDFQLENGTDAIVVCGTTGEASTIGDGFILVGTILFWSVVLDAISYRWPRLGRILKARPKPLIENGQLNRRVMRRELMTDVEVYAQLRLHGIEHLHQVHRAYLEPNGMISVVPVADEDEDEETIDPLESRATD